MQNTYLEMSNVSKTFPGVKALNNVKFDIRPGEVHALVGENGAGKSTLIKILSGFQSPDEGAVIKIEGKETKLNGVMDAIKQGIAVIYQDFSLFRNLTVAENIGINDIIEENKMTLNWKKINKKAEKALSILGSDISPKETVENLSIAKQQMVAIASAIAQDAKMIVMDEPTSALSKGEVENLYTIIDSLKEKNIAIMFVSHKMDELFHVADRFTIFRDGTYVGTVDKDDIDENGLVSMMVGRKVEIKSYANLEKKNEVALEVKNLSKKGNFKDINFKLYKGEVLGITGLVGAGRSEMVQAIFGINLPCEGQILIEGKEVQITSPAKALEQGIAYIPESRQTQGLVLAKTIESNITLPMLKKFKNKFGLVDRKTQRASVDKWVTMLDVRPNNPDMLAMQLSGGNQQKVVLAKWIATEAKILIVDEPTNGVDIGAKAEIHQILRKLAAEGTAVIVISSELPEVLSVSDRILVMRRGRITLEIDNKEVTQEMIMSKAVL
ncbi:monosaccharide ABC transporter ATP-binding protein (CUT2 family) [Lachnotalea glycerini]|uniref:Monosaccharide ABC transporter ATP-binding protein (CUT2 family) n=2 Tax=Lachnotalea glycerini TaxID=1763509 RepID=A0A255IC58_9FIRM|nr:sugar ABC transporter ATP-binding protein [Lachnotalea glycerini]PXV84744.1 monosaccharide ABC transporter ATP-binding protein (CUT2 family) [Lachnotalea glycerini]RDY30842.1 sugar ABC transporter ATP-binding protein [Lachnotalea glycerini]